MRRALLSNVLVALLAAGGAWFARGIYDAVFMDEGLFHVFNATEAERSIELAFPSGERRGAAVAPGQAVEFHVARTGEGAVLVMSDGKRVGSVGYVTSHNTPSVIIVQPDAALFSSLQRGQR